MNKGDFKLSPASEKILSTVRPDLQRVIRRAAELTTTPFAVVSGNRTVAEQQRLYSQGRSRPGLVVTWVDGVKTKSNHQGGAAIDMSAVDANGNPTNHLKHTWNASYYKPIADVILAAGKEIGIPVEWPLWKKGDWGHIQLRKPYRPITMPEMTKLPLEQTTNSGIKTDEKMSVLQPGSNNSGSRDSMVLSNQPKNQDGRQQAATKTPGPIGTGLQGLQQPVGKSDVPHNAGSNGVPSGKAGKEGGGGAQASLPAASYRPPVAGEQSVNLSLPGPAMSFLEAMGWERHQAAALVANGVWESGGKTFLETRALGDKGTAHGAFQWRGDRYSGPNGLLSFAMTHCPGHSSSEPWVQLKYAHWELTEGNEKRAGRLLKEAKTLEEANKAAISYLRPVHWTKEAPEKGHGFQRRLEIAQWIMGQRTKP
jgi:hypothetical protein